MTEPAQAQILKINRNTDDIVDAGESQATKYNKIMDFVQEELFSTLKYLNEQITQVDEECSEVEVFNKFTYEAKKMLVEQKIHTLTRLSVIATDRVKLNVGDEGDIKDITTLL